MLAIRDQENLVHGHQQAAASKPLNQAARGVPPKTPGNKYPKTPLKIPLQDENGPAGFEGGRSILGTKGNRNENLVTGGKKGAALDKDAFTTPIGARNRAPLGIKTTNAKTKAFQTLAPLNVKTVEKPQNKLSSARRLKPKVSHAQTVKIDIHGDDTPLKERDVEYCPPKPIDLPYESDVFPEGCLDYEMLKGPNLMKGWQDYYINPVDENGLTQRERQFEAQLAKALNETDERIKKAVEEDEWTIGDVPETFRQEQKTEVEIQKAQKVVKISSISSKGPATIASRKAASALSVIPKAVPIAPKVKTTAAMPKPSFLVRSKKGVPPPPVNAPEMRHCATSAASRSTIGYTKGRTTSSVLNMGNAKPRSLARSVSNLSASSDVTITPENFTAQKYAEVSDQWRRLKLLGAFDTNDEDLEPGLRGQLPECLRSGGEDEDEFVMTLGPN